MALRDPQRLVLVLGLSALIAANLGCLVLYVRWSSRD